MHVYDWIILINTEASSINVMLISKYKLFDFIYMI